MPGAPGEVTGLVEDTDGAIWVAGGRGLKALKRYARGKWQSINEQWGVPDDEAVSAVLPARDGTVWLATQTQVFFLRHGSKRFEATGLMITNGAGLAQDRAGRIWLSDAQGTKVPSRSNRMTPSCASRLAIPQLITDTARLRRRPAEAKLPSSTTVRKMRS